MTLPQSEENGRKVTLCRIQQEDSPQCGIRKADSTHEDWSERFHLTSFSAMQHGCQLRTQIVITFSDIMHFECEHTNEPALQERHMKASAALSDTHKLAAADKHSGWDGVEFSGLESTSRKGRQQEQTSTPKGNLTQTAGLSRKVRELCVIRPGVESTNKSIRPTSFSSRGIHKISQLSDAGLPALGIVKRQHGL